MVLGRVQPEVEPLSQGADTWDVLSQLPAGDTASTGMETTSARSKYRDVRLLCLIPNASFLSPTWGRGGRPQTNKEKNE